MYVQCLKKLTVGYLVSEVLLFCLPSWKECTKIFWDVICISQWTLVLKTFVGLCVPSLQLFLIGLLCFCTLNFWNLPSILKLYSARWTIGKSESLCPILATESLAEQSSVLMRFHVSVSFHAFGEKPMSLPPHRSPWIPTSFLSFIAFHVPFKFMIHLEFMFKWEAWIKFILSPIDAQLPLFHLQVRLTIFPLDCHCIFGKVMQKRFYRFVPQYSGYTLTLTLPP